MSQRLRAVSLWLHTWSGLITGLVLSVVCATGAMLAFEDEITEAMHPELYEVDAPASHDDDARLPLETLIASTHDAAPEAEIGALTVHRDPHRSVEVSAGRGDTIFVDPYDGRVLGRRVYRETAFFKVFALHRWLLADKVGKLIVGVCTLVFCGIVLTGIVTWWPKSRRQWRARLSFKRGTTTKRKIFDLHVVLGIYAALFLFVMGFTGLAWSFEWFHAGIYRVTGSSMERPEPPHAAARGEAAPLDLVLDAGRAELGPAAAYTLRLAGKPGAPASVSAVTDAAPHDKARDTVYLDPASVAVLGVERFADQSAGRRTRSTFYAIHIGTVGGWPTRVLAFLACVIGATLPLTGMIMWYNKRAPRWRRRRRREHTDVDSHGATDEPA